MTYRSSATWTDGRCNASDVHDALNVSRCKCLHLRARWSVKCQNVYFSLDTEQVEYHTRKRVRKNVKQSVNAARAHEL